MTIYIDLVAIKEEYYTKSKQQSRSDKIIRTQILTLRRKTLCITDFFCRFVGLSLGRIGRMVSSKHKTGGKSWLK
jgi:hypothetical protein